MSKHVQGAVDFVANNHLTYTHGPQPVETLPTPADQFGHVNPEQKQPSWAEIASVLETPEVKARVADLLSRYPKGQGALLEVLWIAQDAIGWLPHEAIRWAARECGCAPAHAFGVATFYTMYKHAPTGRFLLQFCRNICCHLKRAQDVLKHTLDSLNIKSGGTTPDGLFTVVEVECLAACGLFTVAAAECLAACRNAPLMLVNDDNATDADYVELPPKQGVCLTTER